MALYAKAKDVSYQPIRRTPTHVPELDYMYGHTEGKWGLPQGKITLLSGSAGMGKTRFLVMLSKKMADSGLRVLYIQSEVTPQQFVAEKISKNNVPDEFYVSDQTDLENQLQAIDELKPALVIVDSAQQIEEFEGGRGAKEVVRRYREVLERHGTHVVLVCQQNQDGSAKGGSEFKHEVDVVIRGANNEMSSGQFFLTMDEKNRYGKCGEEISTVWEHRAHGVVPFSHIRVNDKYYWRTKPDYDKIRPVNQKDQKSSDNRSFWDKLFFES